MSAPVLWHCFMPADLGRHVDVHACSWFEARDIGMAHFGCGQDEIVVREVIQVSMVPVVLERHDHERQAPGDAVGGSRDEKGTGAT